MSANNDQEVDGVIQALKKYFFQKSIEIFEKKIFLHLDTVVIKLNLQIIISVHQSCVYFIYKIKQI
jgi:hypothetical protein